MKRIIIVYIMLNIAIGLPAFDNLFFSFGTELGGKAREGVSTGGALTFGFDLNYLAFGLKTSFNHDFNSLGAFDAHALLRYYLPFKIKGPFLQAEAGTVLFLENGNSNPFFSGGLEAGWRIMLKKNWYLEPTLQAGYPYIWSAGITAGYKLPIKNRKTPPPAPTVEEEHKLIDNVYISLGPEINSNTRSSVSSGGSITFGYDQNQVAMGLKSSFSHDFNTVGDFNTNVLFRYYLPLKKQGPFVQAEAGTIIFFEDGINYPWFSGGLAAGWRITFKENWYLEPAARGGYPHIWGFSIAAGYKIPIGKRERLIIIAETKDETAVIDEQVNLEEEQEALAAQINLQIEAFQITDTSARVTDEGITISLSNIQFLANSAQLPESEQRKLRDIAKILEDIPGRILVTGHTALAGSEEDRLRTSLERASAVAAFLVLIRARDVDEILAQGFGSQRPIADNSTPEGMALNRRVEITIINR